MKSLLVYATLLRPKHWIKNFLVFSAPFFSVTLLKDNYVEKYSLLFIAFSCVASAAYIINDIKDRKEDINHPKKKGRPIAKGVVSKKNALILLFFLITIVMLCSTQFSWKTNSILATYLVLNIFYSFYFKYIPLVDIFAISSMYLMRIFAGGFLFDIYISRWLILCTFFLSLFLIIAKRRAEFSYLGNAKMRTRKVLRLYTKDFLDHMLTITTTTVIVAYSLYAINLPNPYSVYSIIIAAFGIFRYLYLAYLQNEGESPESLVLRDKVLFATIIAWGSYMGVMLYVI